jgi:HK97 family phage portal protein
MTSVIRGGRPQSVGAKSWPFPTGNSSTVGPTAGYMPLLGSDGGWSTYEGIYKSQPMVFAAVNKIVNGAARNPFKVYEYDVDGESRRRVRSHPLAQLLKRPHPGGSQFGLFAQMFRSCEIHGQALWVKYRPATGEVPTELWPVPWKFVQVIRDERGPIGYNVVLGAKTYTLGTEQVVHFDPRDGISPLEPLRRTLALEDAAAGFSAEAMRNGVNGGRVVFSHDQKINDQAFARLREDLTKIYSGSENAGKPIIGDAGLKATSLTVKATDMELVSLRRFSREEVCAVYDISPALLGLEKASFASAVEYRKALYDAIAARITYVEQTIQAQLIDVEPAWDGVFVEADMDALLREDSLARAQAHMLNLQAGVRTRNEARRIENLPPIDDPLADTVLVPINMAPLDGTGTLGSDTAGTPLQGIADPATFPNQASALEMLVDAVKSQPAPVVNVTVPEPVATRTKRIERDEQGNIARIVEE